MWASLSSMLFFSSSRKALMIIWNTSSVMHIISFTSICQTLSYKCHRCEILVCVHQRPRDLSAQESRTQSMASIDPCWSSKTLWHLSLHWYASPISEAPQYLCGMTSVDLNTASCLYATSSLCTDAHFHLSAVSPRTNTTKLFNIKHLRMPLVFLNKKSNKREYSEYSNWRPAKFCFDPSFWVDLNVCR